jgi:hypothetical protein
MNGWEVKSDADHTVVRRIGADHWIPVLNAVMMQYAIYGGNDYALVVLN